MLTTCRRGHLFIIQRPVRTFIGPESFDCAKDSTLAVLLRSTLGQKDLRIANVVVQVQPLFKISIQFSSYTSSSLACVPLTRLQPHQQWRLNCFFSSPVWNAKYSQILLYLVFPTQSGSSSFPTSTCGNSIEYLQSRHTIIHSDMTQPAQPISLPSQNYINVRNRRSQCAIDHKQSAKLITRRLPGRLIGWRYRSGICTVQQDGYNEKLVEFGYGSSREERVNYKLIPKQHL